MGDEKLDNIAQSYHTGFPTGLEILHDPIMNKGTAFTREERDELGLWGLLPPFISTLEEQAVRVMQNFERKPTDLERYIQLMALLDRNETLFYRVVRDNLEKTLPIVYTPTVGQACQEYGQIFRKPRGIFLSPDHRGRFTHLLRNWSHDDVHVIVVTDGERVLGLGDLGVYGMGVAVGQMVLYSACAGVHPSFCLPVTLDVGTDNQNLLNDPHYLGTKRKRLRGDAYDDMVEEFVMAVQEVFPEALIQFEDIANVNAFRLLKMFQKRVCTFNDDIQGTAAMALAGLYSAFKITKKNLSDQKILFLGAGGAGVGTAELIVSAMIEEGLTEAEARQRCWFVDSKGLVVKTRGRLAEHKIPFAHDHAFCPDLLSAVKALEPTTIIGVSGNPQSFTQPVLETMAAINERPVVFAFSNPPSRMECSAAEAYAWTQGRALFACGTLAEPVTLNGKRHAPGQGNTALISPGVGLGVMSCEARYVIDEMFFAAAKTLAGQVTEADLKEDRIYPPLTRIRETSASIAIAVAEVAYNRGLARRPEPSDLSQSVRSQMYDPVYSSYV